MGNRIPSTFRRRYGRETSRNESVAGTNVFTRPFSANPNTYMEGHMFHRSDYVHRAIRPEDVQHETCEDPVYGMRVDETTYSSRDDVINGTQTLYDAFISYTVENSADRLFVREMIEELEKKRDLKLFVPGRNDLPGAAMHVINAYLIERRCRRVVVIISKSSLKSASCDFQVNFAHALCPGGQSKRVIPVIREEDTGMPRILKFLAVCDFTKPDMFEWGWDRLHSAIMAPIGSVKYFDDNDPSNPFASIDLAAGVTLEANEEQVRAELSIRFQSLSTLSSQRLLTPPPPQQLYRLNDLNKSSLKHRPGQKHSFDSNNNAAQDLSSVEYFV